MPRPRPRRQRQLASSAGPDAALTEVVSTFLLLAIAVGFAGGFSLLLASLPPPQGEPLVTFGTFVLPTATDTLVLEHQGGRPVALRSLTVSLDIGGAFSRTNVGEALAASDPKWSVVAASGALRGPAERLLPGDQVRYTDSLLRGVTTSVSILDEGRGTLAMASAVVQQADTTRPQLTTARTTSTTTLRLNFTEALSSIAAADFTVAGHTISTATLLGDGSSAELVVNTMTTGETPLVSVVASPAGSRDLANNLLLGGTSAAPADGIPPAVSEVVTATGNKTAFVNWTSSEAATGWLDYGPDAMYGLGAATPSGTTHSASLADLTPSTLYHFRITVRDAAGNNLTTEPDRNFLTQDLDGTGGGGGGGGGTTIVQADPPPHFLEFSTIPAGNLEPGIVSGTFTITLRNTTGAAVTPTSALTVNLTTNSTRGSFRDTAGTGVVTSVTISGGSTAQFRYVDLRNGGPSVLLAAARNVTPASAVMTVTKRGGMSAEQGDSVASVRVNIVYLGEQDRDESNVILGMNILNPTPTARTVASVSFSCSPVLGTGSSSCFRSSFNHLSGSDADFTGCTLPGSSTNTLTCDPTDFSLPAWGMKQFLVSFSTSDLSSDDSTIITATVNFAGGAGTATGTWNLRHEGSSSAAFHVEFTALSAAGGTETAGFRSVTGGATNQFNFRWDLFRGSGTVVTKFHVPAMWSNVRVPDQSGIEGYTVAIQQPTSTAPGYVLVTQVAGDRDLYFEAVPPAGPGLDVLAVEQVLHTAAVVGVGTPQLPVASAYLFGVSIA